MSDPIRSRPRVALRLAGLAIATVLAVGLGAPQAQAQSSEAAAEAYRLEREIERLGQRGAWSGVETKYEQLLEMGVEISRDTHLLGAQAAGVLGKTWERYQRLQAAREVEPDQEILDNLAAIDRSYGRVRLRGNPRWTVRFSRPRMPFAPDQRKSVEYAIYVLENGGGFEGMLPAGTYVLGGEDTRATLEFTVEPGPEWQEIQILRDHAAGGEGIVYHGPVGSIGYAFTATPAPKEVVFVPGEDRHSAQPASASGSGLGVEIGYEIGPTRLVAASASLTYTGLYGGDTWHGVTGWAAAVLRPGDLRVAVGPTYGLFTGSGRGLAEWVDVGQDRQQDPNSSIPYDGRAWVGGVRLSAGYGVVDFDPLQGVVGVDAAWHTDGARTYFAFGLRIGVAPRVPRFEG